MAYFEAFVRWLSKGCDMIARACLFAMMVLIAGNIVLRRVGMPIYGSYDYATYLTTIMVSFSLAYCAVQKGHTQVELLMAFLSVRVRGVVDTVTGVLSLAMFSLITWQLVLYADDMRRAGELSMTSLTPFYPYIYAIAFGCGLLCLVILVELIKSIAEVAKG
jgi:TRAP-type C4-dicarboxylate transport system permease small subunit